LSPSGEALAHRPLSAATTEHHHKDTEGFLKSTDKLTPKEGKKDEGGDP
jgi:hypothetical protein